jgi:hypothetical protein
MKNNDTDVKQIEPIADSPSGIANCLADLSGECKVDFEVSARKLAE